MMKQFLQPFKTLITLLFFGIMFTGNAQFEEQAKLVGDFRESRAEFGTSVDFNNDFVAVGASRETVASGAVYIYKTQGENIEFHQKLTAFDAAEGAEFGGIVRFMDDYLVVASGRANVEEAWMAGALYIYKLDANDEWTFHAKLVASDYQDTALLEQILLVWTQTGTSSQSVRWLMTIGRVQSIFLKIMTAYGLKLKK